MEEMTNKIFETLIKAIIQIVEDAKDKEEAIQKIKALLDK